MDLRFQTAMLSAFVAAALGAGVLSRAPRRRTHRGFAAFSLSIAAWYFTAGLAAWQSEASIWVRANLLCAVFVPVAAGGFFGMFPEEKPSTRPPFRILAWVFAFILAALVMSPLYRTPVVGGLQILFIGTLLAATLWRLYRRATRARSRVESGRVRYLALVGALAAVFTAIDYLPYLGFEIPPVGTFLTLIFLYMLSQSVVRDRLLDLYEMAGRLAVLSLQAVLLAMLFVAMLAFAGERFFLHTVAASLVLLLVLDPLRSRVEEWIHQFLFRERFALERSIADMRKHIAHALHVEDLVRVLIAGFEGARRMTHAGVYIAERDGQGFELAGSFGPQGALHIEPAHARAFDEALGPRGALVIEQLEAERERARDGRLVREVERLGELIDAMTAMNASLLVPIRGDAGTLYGMLAVRDERLRDAFAPEEVDLVVSLGVQAAVAVENSDHYERIRERERLAALGEMAAGLAHEIRNPLGAIKASAQYIAEADGDSGGGGEFMDIIVEEVDRLNRVVSSFLDYARPQPGIADASDVNTVVSRTVQLLGATLDTARVECRLDLSEGVPPVRIDAEHLRQVLLNLLQNAVQAMEATGGILRVSTVARTTPRGGLNELQRGHRAGPTVEIRISDTGPGIPPRVLEHLFVPFVTSKEGGTGLGLAISERIIAAAGGRIDVRSSAATGTTFVIALPGERAAE